MRLTKDFLQRLDRQDSEFLIGSVERRGGAAAASAAGAPAPHAPATGRAAGQGGRQPAASHRSAPLRPRKESPLVVSRFGQLRHFPALPLATARL